MDGNLLREAEKNLETYSHCNLGAVDCAYECSEATSTLGCWNISILIQEQPSCRHLGPDSLPSEWWAANLQYLIASPTAGFWFSTLANGENVSWQQVGKPVSISKNCSDEHHFSTVESEGSQCFAAAGVSVGPHRNILQHGWINCYYATVLGEFHRSNHFEALKEIALQ